MKKRGVGYACSFQGVNYHFGHPDISTVELSVTDANTLLVRTAASDIGEGLEAMLLLVASRSFNGFPISKIKWEGANTLSPEAGGTGASRQSTLTGNAVHQGCINLQERLRLIACELLEVDPTEIAFDGSEVVGSDKRVSIESVFEFARKMGVILSAKGSFQAPKTTDLDVEGSGLPISQFGYATHVAEVEVDTITGEVRIIRVLAFHDSGTILNRIGATAQVEGAIVMGSGFALSEEYLLENGKPVNVGFTNYLIPTIFDTPEIESYFVTTPSPIGSLGVKGLAEIPVVTVVPAIINAIFDACGARIKHLPATPERVLNALIEGS